MAPPQAPERASVLRPLSILGLLLGLVSLYWLIYPSPLEEPQVLHKLSPEHNCHAGENIRSVAVIGAGSAGASAAYYLKKFQFPCQPINITVYERNHYVGGRSTTVSVYDDPYQPVELGASIFVKVNRNLVNAGEEFGLPVKNRRAAPRYEEPEVLGVWNGQEFVFIQSDSTNKYWNIAKLFWKYGMSPLRTQNLMKKTVGSFLKMYDAPHFPFTSLSEVAFDLDLLGATAATGTQFLEANGISERFGHDIVQASTRVNYAQNLDRLHGLETMVCMATDGAMAIEGGNWQIFDGMIKSSGATLLLNTSVTSVAKDSESGKYAVNATAPVFDPAQDIASEDESSYDAIILAAPLQFSNITFHPPLSSPPPQIPYVSLHVTLFTSRYPLSRTAFNLPPDAEMPTTILTTTGPDNATDIPFFSISTLRTVLPPLPPLEPVDETYGGNPRVTAFPEHLYKIFSPAPVSDDFLSRILDTGIPEHAAGDDGGAVTWKHEKIWNSYPYLLPRITFDDIQLDKGVWYTSGIESFISTMETSSLMGMNVAKLVTNQWEDRETMEMKRGNGWEL
ncbi:MAG: hypothetical protein Q9201_006515 [Fulgogasparrea decipioides]